MASTLGIIATTLARPLLSKGAAVAWENRKYLSVLFKTKFGKFKKQDIRFSMSGLYRIRIPNTDKYLMVLNRRISNQLQPVGGVYQRYGSDELFDSWGYKVDSPKQGLGVDEKSSQDLRFMVKGKYAAEVLNWFEKGKERETEPKREFIEELLDTGILDRNTFENIRHKHIRRYSKLLSWSDHFNCHEILVYDIFELIPNEQQTKALKELATFPNDLSKGFAIVSQDEIEQLRLMQDGSQIARIGQHTKLIINQTF